LKAAPFDYVVPATVAQACAVLADADGGATVLAGGQTLVPLMALRMSQPFILVDINKIPELSGIRLEGDTVRIGAMTRQNDLIASGELAERLPVLAEAVRHVGHLQTRNRGTIGGSIAFGEPAAELPATLVALDGSIEVVSMRGARRINARELYIGPYTTTIEPDELVTSVHFPCWPTDTRWIFHEVTRRPGDFALVGLVGALQIENAVVTRAGLAWFAMGDTPVTALQAEQALVGRTVAKIDPAAIAELAIADCQPYDDLHASERYRTRVGKRIFEQALTRALGMVAQP